MILYIDKTEVPDLENLSPSVLRYCIRKAEQARGRYKHLMDYYLGQHDIVKTAKTKVKAVFLCTKGVINHDRIYPDLSFAAVCKRRNRSRRI